MGLDAELGGRLRLIPFLQLRLDFFEDAGDQLFDFVQPLAGGLEAQGRDGPAEGGGEGGDLTGVDVHVRSGSCPRKSKHPSIFAPT